MSMPSPPPSTPITSADRIRVREAVAAAEAKTSGEIYTVVTAISDDYRMIPVLWATLVALLAPVPLIFLTLLPASLIYLIQLLVFVVFAIGLSHPAVALNIVPPTLKHRRARALAVQQFLAHGLHTTEARTGVLIFLSLAERHAEIIADAGISAKVDEGTWKASMDKLIAEVRQGKIADGLVAAIESTGAVLARHFPRGPNDRNELANDLVIL
jgi:putative membrane protein